MSAHLSSVSLNFLKKLTGPDHKLLFRKVINEDDNGTNLTALDFQKALGDESLKQELGLNDLSQADISKITGDLADANNFALLFGTDALEANMTDSYMNPGGTTGFQNLYTNKINTFQTTA
jgi:hypothetical protein